MKNPRHIKQAPILFHYRVANSSHEFKAVCVGTEIGSMNCLENPLQVSCEQCKATQVFLDDLYELEIGFDGNYMAFLRAKYPDKSDRLKISVRGLTTSFRIRDQSDER